MLLCQLKRMINVILHQFTCRSQSQPCICVFCWEGKILIYRVSQKNALSELASISILGSIPTSQPPDQDRDPFGGQELSSRCKWKPILKVRFLGHPVVLLHPTRPTEAPRIILLQRKQTLDKKGIPFCFSHHYLRTLFFAKCFVWGKLFTGHQFKIWIWATWLLDIYTAIRKRSFAHWLHTFGEVLFMILQLGLYLKVDEWPI